MKTIQPVISILFLLLYVISVVKIAENMLYHNLLLGEKELRTSGSIYTYRAKIWYLVFAISLLCWQLS